MKTKISPALLCILSVFALILVCFIVMPGEGGNADPHAGHSHANQPTADPHAGHNHGTQSTGAHAGHNHADKAHNKTAKESYELVKSDNGTYFYRVISRAGHTYNSQEIYMHEPTLTEIDKDTILVSGQRGKMNNLSCWAIYYNVEGEGQASKLYDYVLASTKDAVAYLHGDSGKFQVVVCDPFNDQVTTRTELEGLTVAEGGNPKISYEMLKNGDLQVSYTANGINQVVNIKLK